MTISFDEINRIMLRVVFAPMAERELRALGVQLPTPWHPSDEELERLARTYAALCASWEDASEDPREDPQP